MENKTIKKGYQVKCNFLENINVNLELLEEKLKDKDKEKISQFLYDYAFSNLSSDDSEGCLVEKFYSARDKFKFSRVVQQAGWQILLTTQTILVCRNCWHFLQQGLKLYGSRLFYGRFSSWDNIGKVETKSVRQVIRRIKF